MVAREALQRSRSSVSVFLNQGLWRVVTLIRLALVLIVALAYAVGASAMGPDQGEGPVRDSVIADSGSSSHTGTLTNAGQAFIVTEAGSGSTDPLLDQQWHLKLRSQEPAGSNVRAVWPTTKGAGIAIGIVDDGLQHTHPDLQPNYAVSLSWDFNNNDSDPSPSTLGLCSTTADCHGTAVAGVAGAMGDNGIGVSGAAPSASLAGLRLTADPVSDAQVAAALGHQGDAIQIINNSWGASDNGSTLARPGPLTQSAIETAIVQGRNGKGRLFLWAAGNGLEVQDNCNFDGYANGRFVIAVGALADNAQQAPYSEPCSAMFATAPSDGGSRGITTTDLVGSPGYDPTDYTSSFGGTSSATPLVSGVVALMLAENPSLTWRDVKHILAESSVRINSTDPGWTIGTFPHNEEFGFGLVDAQAAVNLAATWSNVAAESAIPAVTRAINQTIPDDNATGLWDSITISSSFVNFTVEHVEVEFDATHPWRGDLEITLTSPAGVASRLATVRPLDSGDNFTSWRFGSVRHWGESAVGTWTLQASDRDMFFVGTWNSWTLRIYGTVPPLTLTTGSLPTGEQRVFYLFGLRAEGGFPPYTWSLIKSKLPKGLTLDAAGTLSGIPTKARTATFTVQVTDATGASATQTFSLKTVKPVKFKGSSLSRSKVGTPYSATLRTNGGIPPLTFSLIGGALPPGLNIDPGTGQISGTPTTAGTFDFQVRVASSGGSTDQRAIRIKIR